MEQLALLLEALSKLFMNPEMLLFIFLGTSIGIIFGAIPGLSGTVGIALMIPFSFYMSPLAAISMMYAMHKGDTYGGSITAILMNTPGTAAAACTAVDGYALTKQGKAGKALHTAVISSAIGDFLSDLLLIFATFYIAQFVWAFGPVEMAGILFFALTLISTVTGKSIIKGLVAAFIGLFFAAIGLDPMNASPRLTFGNINLMSGLSLIPVLIGLFVVSEVFVRLEEKAKIYVREKISTLAPRSKNRDDNRLTFKEFKSITPTILLSYFIGQMIGIMPGIGAAIAPWISYGQARTFSKHPEEFGQGSLQGIAAAEASNNAVCGANLIPLLTLGIPGSTTVALIMGVFMLHGIEFGPRIFVESGDLVYGIFAAGLLAIATYFLIGFFLSRRIGDLVTRIPTSIIFPMILIVTFIGSYVGNNSLFDIGVLVFFGVLGFILRKHNFPLPPLIIAFMLGERFENSLRQSLIMSKGNLLVFFQHPISLTFILIAVVALAINIYKGRKPRQNRA